MIPVWLRGWMSPRRRGPESPSVPELSDPGLDAAALELHARGLSEGLWAGTRRSLFRGAGMEVDGVRSYVPGDDARAVDWRVTARTGRLHVRDLVEERGTEVVVVLDRSASLYRGLSPLPGRCASLAAAVLCTVAYRTGHRVGLVQACDRLDTAVAPEMCRGQLQRILARISEPCPPGRGGNLSMGVRRAGAMVTSRSLVVVVSDFRFSAGDRADLGEALGRIGRRHDVLPVRVRVPGAEDLPEVGPVAVEDAEEGMGVVIRTSDPAARARIQRAASEREDWWQDLLLRLGTRAVELDPFTDVGSQLRLALESRAREAR